ncbi:3-hydroxyacyl-ACP dehydratase FabZ [Agitococcus lubricus]|uniref:3-hydroxyacyl-[acyl-carrier-protein] dehydratase FabZ n=1 Tax=Agitococcus lubricus TaxID=1077255 RepID=A0A2T5J1L1_9GAMM|nr:3-hydroxyacyl-ACP dehydratase FabZ [Agitococcus lubricus]PTQ90317.1 3-hydroxyacyl-[acyl-carrier-protein] dehydratase [Agitococcus lubricus]
MTDNIQLPLYTDQIKELLPHRYPFLLIDRVTDIELGRSVQGYKNVTINEEYFNGHFPEHPVMPGMLILEAMAQVSGILGFLTSGKRPADGHIYLFVGADNTRFKRQVIPGDCLTLYSEFVTSKRHIHKFSCRAMVGNELAASADILVAEQVI